MPIQRDVSMKYVLRFYVSRLLLSGARESVAAPTESVAAPTESAAAPRESVAGEAKSNDEKAETDATNNNSNLNRNNKCSDDDEDDDDDDSRSERFMSAWEEVWKDLQTVLYVTPELSSVTELRHEELIKFPDETVEALAQSLVGDVYLSVSKCQDDPETIEDHQNRLVSSLISELHVQPLGHSVRTIS